MGSPKALFILTMIIFVGMMIVNSIISGIREHNTWRIVIAAVSSVVMIIPVVLIIMRLNRIKKQ